MTIRPFQSFISKGYFTYLDSDIKNSDQPLRNRPRFSGVIILDKELRTLVARKTVSASVKIRPTDSNVKHATEAYVKGRSRANVFAKPLLDYVQSAGKSQQC